MGNTQDPFAGYPGEVVGATTSGAASVSTSDSVDVPALIDEYAKEHPTVDPFLLHAMSNQESGRKARRKDGSPIVSPKGARGPMQLMPDTARRLGVKNIDDPRENVEAGVRLLDELLTKYDGDEALALAAYHAGEPAVDKFKGGIPTTSDGLSTTFDYVRNILDARDRFRQSNQPPVAEADDPFAGYPGEAVAEPAQQAQPEDPRLALQNLRKVAEEKAKGIDATPTFKSEYEADPNSIDAGLAKKFYQQVVDMNPDDTGVVGATKRYIKSAENHIPFLGLGIEALELKRAYEVAIKAQRGEQLTTNEKAVLDAFATYVAAGERFDPGLIDKATEVALNIPTFVAEFAATGGGYTAARQGVLSLASKFADRTVAEILAKDAAAEIGTEAAKKAVKESLRKGVVAATKRGVIQAGGWAAGSTVQTAMQPMLETSILKRMMPEIRLTPTDAGDLTAVVDKNTPDFWKAVGKGFGDTALQIFTERMGFMAEKATAPVEGWLKKRLLGAWVDRLGIKGVDWAADAARKAEWNGMIGEVFEEEVGQPFQNWLDDKGFQYDLDKDRLATEFLGFAAFGALAKGVNYGTGTAGQLAERWNNERRARAIEALSQQQFGKSYKGLENPQKAAVLYDLSNTSLGEPERNLLLTEANALARQSAEHTTTRIELADGKTVDLVLPKLNQVEKAVQADFHVALNNLAVQDLHSIGLDDPLKPYRDRAREQFDADVAATVAEEQRKAQAEAQDQRIANKRPYEEAAELEGEPLEPIPVVEGKPLDAESLRQQWWDDRMAEARATLEAERARRAEENLQREQQLQGEQQRLLEQQQMAEEAEGQAQGFTIIDRRQVQGESDYQELERLNRRLSEIAEDKFYTDARFMARSLEDEKRGGRQLQPWQQEALDLLGRKLDIEARLAARGEQVPTQTTPQSAEADSTAVQELLAFNQTYQAAANKVRAAEQAIQAKVESLRQKGHGNPENPANTVKQRRALRQAQAALAEVEKGADQFAAAWPQLSEVEKLGIAPGLARIYEAAQPEASTGVKATPASVESSQTTEPQQATQPSVDDAIREIGLRQAEEALRAAAARAATPEEADTLIVEAQEAGQLADEILKQRARAIAAAQTGEATEYPMGPTVPMLRGKDCEIILPGGDRLPAYFAVVSLRNLTYSHDPFTFQWNPEYVERGKNFQPRDYLTNEGKQASVIAIGAGPDPVQLHYPSPFANDGPPIVREDGVAVNNGRLMGQKRAYKLGNGGIIRDDIVRQAAQFGIQGEIPQTFDEPVLVRILKNPVTDAQQAARLGVLSNEGQNHGYSEAEESIKLAQLLTKQHLEWIAEESDNLVDSEEPLVVDNEEVKDKDGNPVMRRVEPTLRDVITKNEKHVIEIMKAAGMIAPGKESAYITREGKLTKKGKDSFEQAVLGKLIPDAYLIETAPSDAIGKVSRALAQWIRVKSNSRWDITPYLEEALRLLKAVNSARPEIDANRKRLKVSRTKASDLELYLHPEKYGTGFVENAETGAKIDLRPTPHPITEALARMLEKNVPSAEAKQAVGEYTKEIKNDIEEQGGLGLIARPEPVVEFNATIGKLVGIEVSPDDWGTLKPMALPEAAVAPAEIPASPAAALPAAAPAAPAARVDTTESVSAPPSVVLPESQPAVDTTAKPETEHKYSYGSTQVNIPESEAAMVRELAAMIPDADLAGDGREDQVHITLRYGLTEPDAAAVAEVIKGTGPITVTLGKTNLFPPSESSDGAAVLYVEVKSPELEALHEKIDKSGLPMKENSFPDYRPHATVAYLVPSRAKKYKGMEDLEGTKFVITELAVTDRDGGQQIISLQNPAQNIPENISPEEGAAPVAAVKPEAPEGGQGGAIVDFSMVSPEEVERDGFIHISNGAMNDLADKIGVRKGKVAVLVNVAGELYAPLDAQEADGWGREITLWPVSPLAADEKAEPYKAGETPDGRTVQFEGQKYIIGDEAGLKLYDERRALTARYARAGGDSEIWANRKLSDEELEDKIARLEASNEAPKPPKVEEKPTSLTDDQQQQAEDLYDAELLKSGKAKGLIDVDGKQYLPIKPKNGRTRLVRAFTQEEWGRRPSFEYGEQVERLRAKETDDLYEGLRTHYEGRSYILGGRNDRIEVPRKAEVSEPPKVERPRRNYINSNALEDALSPEAQKQLAEMFSRRTEGRNLREIRAAMEVYERLLEPGPFDKPKASQQEREAFAQKLRDAVDNYFTGNDPRRAYAVQEAIDEGLKLASGDENADWMSDLAENEVFADAADAGKLIFDTLDPKTASFDTEEFNTAFGDVEFRREPDEVFPKPKETVDYLPPTAKAQLPVISQEEANRRVEAWKKAALEVAKQTDNRNKVIYSLFDESGVISKPWEEAGYTVRRFDIQHGKDLTDFGEWMMQIEEDISEGLTPFGVIAQPPCTSYTLSGVRWWPTQHDAPNREMVRKKYGETAAKLFDKPLDYANTLVATVKLFIGQADPTFYAMENPAYGRINTQNGLPKAVLGFNPHNFGDPWTKQTQLWGEFNADLPLANVEPTEGSKAHKLTGFNGKDKKERSLTPTGFAYAFFMANDPTAQQMLAEEQVSAPPSVQSQNKEVVENRQSAGAAVEPPPNIFETEVQPGDHIEFMPKMRTKQESVSGQVVDVIRNQEGHVGYHVLAPTDSDPQRVVRIWATEGAVVKVLPDGNKLNIGMQETLEHAAKWAERHNEREREKAGLFADQVVPLTGEEIRGGRNAANGQSVERDKQTLDRGYALKEAVRRLVTPQEFADFEAERKVGAMNPSTEAGHWNNLLAKLTDKTPLEIHKMDPADYSKLKRGEWVPEEEGPVGGSEFMQDALRMIVRIKKAYDTPEKTIGKMREFRKLLTEVTERTNQVNTEIHDLENIIAGRIPQKKEEYRIGVHGYTEKAVKTTGRTVKAENVEAELSDMKAEQKELGLAFEVVLRNLQMAHQMLEKHVGGPVPRALEALVEEYGDNISPEEIAAMAKQDFRSAMENNASMQARAKEYPDYLKGEPQMRVEFEHAIVFGTTGDALTMRQNKSGWGKFIGLEPLHPDDRVPLRNIGYTLKESSPQRKKWEVRDNFKNWLEKWGKRKLINDARKNNKADFLERLDEADAHLIKTKLGLQPDQFWRSVKTGRLPGDIRIEEFAQKLFGGTPQGLPMDIPEPPAVEPRPKIEAPKRSKEVEQEVASQGGMLPGFEGAVEGRIEAEQAAQGEDLSDQMLRPKGNVSQKAGDIERNSPLFAGTEASGNMSLFGGQESVPEPPQAEAPQGKEPWQMTIEEFKQSERQKQGKLLVPEHELEDEHLKEIVMALRDGEDVPAAVRPIWAMPLSMYQEHSRERLRQANNPQWDDPGMRAVEKDEHREEVKAAFESGAPVPAEVLREYPELLDTKKSGGTANDIAKEVWNWHHLRFLGEDNVKGKPVLFFYNRNGVVFSLDKAAAVGDPDLWQFKDKTNETRAKERELKKLKPGYKKEQWAEEDWTMASLETLRRQAKRVALGLEEPKEDIPDAEDEDYGDEEDVSEPPEVEEEAEDFEDEEGEYEDEAEDEAAPARKNEPLTQQDLMLATAQVQRMADSEGSYKPTLEAPEYKLNQIEKAALPQLKIQAKKYGVTVRATDTEAMLRASVLQAVRNDHVRDLARQEQNDREFDEVVAKHGPGSEFQKRIAAAFPAAEQVEAFDWPMSHYYDVPENPKKRSAWLRKRLSEVEAELPRWTQWYENFRQNGAQAYEGPNYTLLDAIHHGAMEDLGWIEESIENGSSGTHTDGRGYEIESQILGVMGHISRTKGEIATLRKELGDSELFPAPAKKSKAKAAEETPESKIGTEPQLPAEITRDTFRQMLLERLTTGKSSLKSRQPQRVVDAAMAILDAHASYLGMSTDDYLKRWSAGVGDRMVADVPVLDQKTEAQIKNAYTWKGQPVYLGVVNVLDGEIEEAISFEQFSAGMKQHGRYLSDNASALLASGEGALFKYDPHSNTIDVGWREKPEGEPWLVARVLEQLERNGKQQKARQAQLTLFQGFEPEDFEQWVVVNQKGLKVQEFGLQPDLFGGAERVFRLTNRSGESAIATEGQLEQLRKAGKLNVSLNTGEVDAPNLGPIRGSQGTLFQAAAPVESEAFQQWFGDSKVVDDSGQPLVVHHQTHMDFEEFDRLWPNKFFGRDPELIEAIGSWFTDLSNTRKYGPKNMDVYLSIQRPLVLEDMPKEMGGNVAWLDLKAMVDELGGASGFREELKKLGYDGVQLKSTDLDGDIQNVWVALEPTQIKSATGNRGTFDASNPNILYQHGPMWISRAADVISQKAGNAISEAPESLVPEKRIPAREANGRVIPERVIPEKRIPAKSVAEQVKEMLRAGGVSETEIEWLGLDEFLKGKKRVTKEELTQWIDAHNLEVQEVMKGSTHGKAELAKFQERRDIDAVALRNALVEDGYDQDEADSILRQLERGDEDLLDQLYEEPSEDIAFRSRESQEAAREFAASSETLREAEEEAEGKNLPQSETKWDKYQGEQLLTPGPYEDYRELLLQMPQQRVNWHEYLKKYYRADVTAEEAQEYWAQRNVPEAVARLWNSYNSSRPEGVFTGSHWDEPNVFAHVRFDTRVDAEGNKVLYIEEVQSDWAREGRKRGYRPRGPITELPPGYTVAEYEGRPGKYTVLNPDGGYALPGGFGIMANSPEEATAKFIKEFNADPNYKGVPDFPFKDNWVELVMKRMLRYASENGFDRIAWVTGEQTQNRYDLTKHIDRLRYKVNENPFDNAPFAGEKAPKATYRLTGYQGGNLKFDKAFADDQLEAALGSKDIAAKIRANEGNGELLGIDLKIGGQWAENLYDRQLPNFLKAYGKKFGGAVGESSVNIEDGPDYSILVDGELYDGARTQQQAESIVADLRAGGQNAEWRRDTPTHAKAHTFTITPAMRDAVLGGQYLMQDKKGATQFLADGRALIALLEKADETTIFHELFHMFRRSMKQEDATVLESEFNIPAQWWTSNDAKVRKQGVTGEEKAARAFERYLHNGEAPTSRLKQVFEDIKSWFRAIYTKLVGSPINVKVSANAKRVFDRILGSEVGESTPAVIAAPSAAEATSQRLAEVGKLAGQGGQVELITANSPREEFETTDEANIWAQVNKAKMLAVQVYQRKDGSAYAIYAPKGGGTLFQRAGESQLDNLEVDNKGARADYTLKNGETVQLEASWTPTGDMVLMAKQGREPIGSALLSKDRDGKLFSQLTQVREAFRNNGIASALYDLAEEAGAKLKPSIVVSKDAQNFWRSRQGQNEVSDPPSVQDLYQAQRGPSPEELRQNIAAIKQRMSHIISDGERRQLAKRLRDLEAELKQVQPQQSLFGGGVVNLWGESEAPQKPSLIVPQREEVPEPPKVEAPPQVEAPKPKPAAAMGSETRRHVDQMVRKYWDTKNLGQRLAIMKDAAATFKGAALEDFLKRIEEEEDAESNRERGAHDAPVPTQKPAGVQEPAGQPGNGQRPVDAGAGSPVRADGAGREGSGSERKSKSRPAPTISLDKAVRERGEPIYSQAYWQERLERYDLPHNLPIPTVSLDPAIRKKLLAQFGQPEVVESILSGFEQHDGFVLASSTGTGKTYMALATIAQRKPEYTILVAPNQDVIKQWIDIAPHFNLKVTKFEGSMADMPTEPGIYAMTYMKGIDLVGEHNDEGIAAFPWDMAIFDESHNARGWHQEKAQFGTMTKAVSMQAKKALFTSATWVHTPLEVGYLDKLGLWKDTGFTAWARQLGITVDPQSGKFRSVPAPRKMAQLREQLIERGQFANMDPSMEGFTAQFGVVPLTTEQFAKLRDINQAFTLVERYYNSQKRRGEARAAKANRATFIKRYLENIRLPQVVELAKKGEAQGYKVIIFSENKKGFDEEKMSKFLREPDREMGGSISRLLPKLEQVDDYLVSQLGPNKMANFSGSAGAGRTAEKDAFLEDEKLHLYATYAAGGTGLSLHDTGGDRPRLGIYLGLPWSGVAFDQARGRFWRYGTKSNAIGIFITSDAAPEMDLIMSKVAPRLESLKAGVSGIDTASDAVRNMMDIDKAIAYELGAEESVDADAFSQRGDASAIQRWDRIEIPHASTMIGEGKGMKAPGAKLSEETLDKGPITLWQEEAKERAKKVSEAVRDSLGGVSNPPSASEPDYLKVVRETLAKRAMQAAGESMTAKQKDAVVTGLEATLADEVQTSMAGGSGGDGNEPPDPTPVIANKASRLKALLDSPLGRTLSKYDLILATQGRNGIRKVGGKIGAEISDRIVEYHLEHGKWTGQWVAEAEDIRKRNKLTPDEWRGVIFEVEGRSDKWIRTSLAAELFPEEWAQAARIKGDIGKSAREAVKLKVQPLLDTFRKAEARITKAAEELRELYGRVAEASRDAGVEVRDSEGVWHEFPENDPEYAHHYYDPKVFDRNSAKHEAIIEAIMEAHGVSRQRAEDILGKWSSRTPVAGSLERTREGDLPGYRTDFGSMLVYLNKAGETIARTKLFGQRREHLDGLISQLEDGKARNYIQQTMDNLLERKEVAEEANWLASFAGDWTVITKMTLSAIPNFSQWINASLRTNLHDTMIGVAKYLADVPYWDRRALLSGSITEQNMSDLMKELGSDRSFTQKLLDWTQFSLSDRVSRGMTQAIAEQWMVNTALPRLINDPSSVHRRLLKQHFSMSDEAIDHAIVNKKWDDADLLRGAKRVNDDTQFTFDPTELPTAWRNKGKDDEAQLLYATLRIATLLKSYAFKQAVLIKDGIVKEALHTENGKWSPNLRPLLAFAVLFPLIGELVRDLLDAIKGGLELKRFKELLDLGEDNLEMLAGQKDPAAVLARDFKRAVDNIGGAGGFGLMTMAWDMFSTTGDFAMDVAGPFYKDVFRTIPQAIGRMADKFGDGDGAGMWEAFKGGLNQVVPVTKTVPGLKKAKKPGRTLTMRELQGLESVPEPPRVQ